MRLFIALELSDEIKQNCLALLGDLTSINSQTKWVELQNLHLTLKFLGEVNDGQLPLLINELRELSCNHQAFDLTFSGLGGFPTLNHPKIFWLKGEGGENLPALQKAVEKKINSLDFVPQDRPFSPHLTLGRVKGEKGLKEVIQKFKEKLDYSAGKLTIRKFALIESQLKPTGPIYQITERFSLRGG